MKLALVGLALALAGGLKTYLHVQASRLPDPLLAALQMRCGPGDGAFQALANTPHLTAAVHCWGCAAMIAGLALALLGAVRARRSGAAAGGSVAS